MERSEEDLDKQDTPTDEVVHGGEDDPLGGGVAELEDSDDVTEGIPEQ